MKQVRRGDMMERLIVMMAEEKAKLVELEAQLAEDEQRMREGGRPAATRTDIVGPSTCAEDAQDAKDRA